MPRSLLEREARTAGRRGQRERPARGAALRFRETWALLSAGGARRRPHSPAGLGRERAVRAPRVRRGASGRETRGGAACGLRGARARPPLPRCPAAGTRGPVPLARRIRASGAPGLSRVSFPGGPGPRAPDSASLRRREPAVRVARFLTRVLSAPGPERSDPGMELASLPRGQLSGRFPRAAGAAG